MVINMFGSLLKILSLLTIWRKFKPDQVGACIFFSSIILFLYYNVHVDFVDLVGWAGRIVGGVIIYNFFFGLYLAFRKKF